MLTDLEYQEFEGETGSPETLSLFALSYCEHCHQAIAYLKEEQVSFRYLFLDTVPHDQRGPALRELKQLTDNDLVFPLLISEENVLKGFDPEIWRERLALAAS